MSAPVFYSSSDASAPSLTGQAGSLTALLTAILVNGYGTQPAAGWTVPFTGTNGAVYKQGGGNGFFLTVNDNGPGAGTFKEARASAAESTTAYSATFASSTHLFPTAAQQANGMFIRKSATADATARQWYCIADDRTFYLFVFTGDSAGFCLGYYFGDFYSLLTGDGFRTGFCAKTVENDATLSNDNLSKLSATTTSGTTGHYVARAYTGSGTALNEVACAEGCSTGSGVVGAAVIYGPSGLVYPNPVDNGVYINRCRFFDNSTTFRGWMRGFWSFGNQVSGVADGDTFIAAPGTPLAGRTFRLIKTSGNVGVYFVETSNTWDTSN